MQGLTCFLLLLIISFSLLIIKKDFFHPAVLVSIEWLFIIFLYIFTNHGLYELSIETYLIVFLWVFFFSLCSFASSNVKFSINKKYKSYIPNISFIKRLYLPLLLSNILLIGSIILAYGANFNSIRLGLLDRIPPYVKILFYINTFSYAYFAVICFSNIFKLRKILIFAFFIILTSFFKTNKTTFISFFLLVLFVFRQRKLLNLKTFLFMTIITIGLLVAIVEMRGDKNTFVSFSIGKYLTIYLLSPLTAFDQVVTGKLSVPAHQNGGYVFVFFYKLTSIFTGEKATIFGPWVNVPLPTNVYTVLAPSYIDFGIFGIVLSSSIQGIVWGTIYGFVKRNFLIFKIIYGTMLYYMGLQFFSDYFAYSFSVFIQYVILSIILVVKIRGLQYIFSIPRSLKTCNTQIQ